MQQLQLKNKNIPSDLSTVGRYINAIAGTYMVVAGQLVRYQSKNRGLILEFDIDSLREHQNFKASFGISPVVNKTLSALSKGTRDVIFYSDEKKKQYLITNQHINVNLDYVDVNLMMATVEDSKNDAEQIGPPVNISSRHELGITGREKTVPFVIRDNTLSGIINTSGEYFFDPDYTEEAGVEKRIYKSCFFLKIGKEQFSIRLYRQENSYLLLTKVSIGTGIQCRMLETLKLQ